MPRFVATLRAIYDAQDEVEAMLVADKICENGSADLDDSDDDSSLEVTQVVSNGLQLLPQEMLSRLRIARNLLIKTRIKQCYELAQELDRVIFALEHREDPGFSIRAYDYGAFIDLADRILMKGETPYV